MKSVSPFRWVGSKNRLLPVLLEYLPSTPVNYFEPFAGGASLFFAYGHRAAGKAYLNDINFPLINAYEMLRKYCMGTKDFLFQLDGISYEVIRSQFNALKQTHTIKDLNERELRTFAGLFIALNHLCFNGLYRENKAGAFNVPVGTDSKGIPRSLKTLPVDKLTLAAFSLDKAQLFCASFSPWPFPITPIKGDVVFFDPAYLKEFSGYSKEGFTADHHLLLAAQAGAIAKKGATVIVCGSNNDASKEIYGEPTRIVELNRTVGNFKNSDKKRGKATEALWIWNGVKQA